MRDASGRPLKPTITRASSEGCAAAIPMVNVLAKIETSSRMEPRASSKLASKLAKYN